MSKGLRRNSYNVIEIHSGCPTCVMHFNGIKPIDIHFLHEPSRAAPQQQVAVLIKSEHVNDDRASMIRRKAWRAS